MFDKNRFSQNTNEDQSQLAPEFLYPAQADEFLPPINQWIRLGGLFVCVTFGIAFLLTNILKHKIAVKALGIVRPADDVSIVQATVEGIVENINVKENQIVQAGETIIHTRNPKLQTQERQTQNSLQQLQLQLTQINAQLLALNKQISAESSLLKHNIAVAEANLNISQRNYKDYNIATRAEVLEAEAATTLAREELDRFEQLANTGAIAQSQILEKQAALKIALARLTLAESTLNPSDANVVIASEQIVQERFRSEVNLSMLNRERSALLQTQIELQNEISHQKEELQRIETELMATTIQSPVSGTIQQLYSHNVNQYVQVGDVIAQIVPNDASLTFKASVMTQNIDLIELGQAVRLQIFACPYTNYGTLQGAVSSISPDIKTYQNGGVISPQEASFNGENIAYEVAIQPTNSSLRQGKHNCEIQPGMEGRASIITEEVTILNFILRKLGIIVTGL